jgi:predicted dehydrogenase
MFPHGCRTGFAAEVHDFVEAVLRKGRPEIGADEGLRILALCESCYESAAAGRPVSYQEVLSGALASYQEPIDEKWDL